MNGNNNLIQEINRVRQFPYIIVSIAITLIIMLAYLVAQGSLMVFIPMHGTVNLMPYVMVVTQILFMFVPTVIAARFIPIPRGELFRLLVRPQFRDVALGILGIIAMQFLVSGWAALQEFLVPESISEMYDMLRENIRDIYEQLLGGGTIWAVFQALVIGAAVPAVSEEFLFRGLLQKSLEEKLRPWKAMLIAAVIFGFIHFNPIDILPLIYIGFFLGYFAYHTRTIAVPIILHFFNNAIAVIVINIPSLKEFDESTYQLPTEYALAFFFGGLAVTIGVMRMIARGRISAPESAED